MAEQQEKKKKKKVRRFYDYGLVFTIIFLTAFGLVMIYSSSSYSAQLAYGDAGYFMKRQGMIALAGLVGMFIVSKINYHFFARFARLSYIVSYILMGLVMTVGIERNGQKRWLGIGDLSFQPTEFVKVALILYLAFTIVKMARMINEGKGLGAIALRA